MKSMTGYGRGEATSDDGVRCVVEASSVNRKQLEVVVVLPPDLAGCERKLRSLAQETLSRGQVRLAVELTRAGDAVEKPHINRALALAYLEEMRALADEAGEKVRVNFSAVLRLPGVIEDGTDTTCAEVSESLWSVMEEASRAALGALVAMRKEEGLHLRDDLSMRLGKAREHLAGVEALEPQVVEAQKKRLFARLNESGIDLDWEDERLAKEIGMFAERCDISEETTRLHSHFTKFEAMLDSKEPAGRSLDFMAQEMFRELNTITTKGSDAGIAHHAVAAKTEVERMREQIQNVE